MDFEAKSGIGVQLTPQDFDKLEENGSELSRLLSFDENVKVIEKLPFVLDQCGSALSGEYRYYLSIALDRGSRSPEEYAALVEEGIEELEAFLAEHDLRPLVEMWADLLIS